MEECPVYENTHENCSCEHCQQQALETAFTAALHTFYAAEQLPPAPQISLACRQAESALEAFLQKTMSEEASMRYVARISARLEEQYDESTKIRQRDHAERICTRRLEDEFEGALRNLYYVVSILYSSNTGRGDLNRPGVQLHYNASRDCEERLLKQLGKTMSEEEARAHIAAIQERVYTEEYNAYKK